MIAKDIFAKGLLALCLSLFLVTAAYGQHSVKGVVNDQAGEPLPGVNIQVKGTTQGTSTNAQGAYSLTVESESDTLIFSFIGFQRQEVPIQGRQEINITMTPQAIEAGEELVVVGYGTQEQVDLTGSIKRVQSEELNKQPALTATEALQGKVSGVNIIKNDAPGGTPTVIMRGLGTALGGRNPLYIVDGVPVDDINNIAPSDIESIDFLKDAASASIYGLRAANGVIIVTTKQGTEGAAQFEADTYVGYNSVLNKVNMADGPEYVTYFNEENAAVDGFQLNQNQQYDTDWFDELLNQGRFINSKLSVSGGSENINYFFSYNLNAEEGLLDNQKFWRQTLRNNNNYRLFDGFLTLDQNLSISFSRENPMPFGAFNTAYRQSPLVPTFYPNGRYGQPFVNETTGEVTYEGAADETIGRLNTHGNPLTAIDFNNEESNAITLQGNLAADFNLTDYLTFTTRLGATRFYGDTRAFSPLRQQWISGDPTRTVAQYQANKEANPGVTDWADNTLFVTDTETFRWNWDNYLNFSKSFDDHNVDITAGISSEKTGVGKRFRGRAYDIPEQEQYWNLDLATDQYDKIVEHTNFTPNTLLSYFGRVQYNYDRRYYISGTLRRDGSSQFANTEDYWELFPSVGLGWTISNEEFMGENEAISFLKLRASWGRLGNQNVPFNSTVVSTDPGSASQNYVFGPAQALRFGASVGSPARDISWEIVEEWNLGADIEFVDSRLTSTIDVYQKTTKNLILLVNPLPNSQFEGDYFDQGAEVVNQGLELSLNWSDNVSEDFSYNVGTSFSYNKNEITEVETGFEGLTGGSLGNGQITKRLEEGQPLGAWWMYEAVGVWQDEMEIANNPSIGGALPGHLRYNDVNEDGVIDERDKKFFGSYVPNYNYGINIGANYKQFDVSLDAFGVAGNKVYDGLSNTRFGGENIREETFTNRWTGPNSTSEHPGANRDAIASDYYLKDGSYLRINNITLGYSLQNIVNHLNRVRFYISAQNPFMITDYPGFTPELVGNGSPYGTAGIELNAYPNTRSLLLGVNIDFQ
ncbi:SusC/RagA family TonB-linked outer membrane protein [Fodinibius salsisoli]|uniref:TonB-dependent receptor n=1 Tax=Fodinibius salsisoli TaxID=2820877 RepID=A0ABT3PKL2_9BACT|nr:TonB-dependent receptor [Fodinibius salsisoli]MCW9706466.1 TonB-dependent receptor [Fodinibius salsisoli]